MLETEWGIEYEVSPDETIHEWGVSEALAEAAEKASPSDTRAVSRVVAPAAPVLFKGWLTGPDGAEYVREGVCLVCGGAVLNSGEHVDADRHRDYLENLNG